MSKNEKHSKDDVADDSIHSTADYHSDKIDRQYVRISVLKDAIGIDDDRSKVYGRPERNFDNIAGMWNAYLKIIGVDANLGPSDVSLMMALMKVCRIAGTDKYHTDSFVDGANYIALAASIMAD